MATTDELKKDGSTVKPGAVSPNQITKGFAPNGVGDTASLDSRVSQIPSGAGTSMAAPGTTTTTPATRQANPAAVGFGGADEGVIPGTRAVMNGFADDANRNIKEGNYGALAGNTIKATATMPFALAADAARPVTSRLEGVGRGFYNAASTLFGGSERAGNTAPAVTPAAPAVMAPAAANPYASVTPEQGAAMAKVNAGTAPATATPAAPANPNLVTRVGNSYSGGPNISGDIELAGTRGGVISAQNNQAAENLARAGGQTRGFGPSGAIRGGGQVSSMDTSAGYAADLKQLAGIEAAKAQQNASMRDQENYAAMKAGHMSQKTYQAILARNQTDAITRRGQDIQASSVGFANKLAQEKLGLDKAKDGRDATAAGFTSRSAKRVEDLQSAYESAKPEDKAGIAEQLRVLTGKDKAATYKVAAGGQQLDANGMPYKVPDQIYNEQTGEVKRLDQRDKPALPAGMVKQVGTSNGKPVYEDANGKRHS